VVDFAPRQIVFTTAQNGNHSVYYYVTLFLGKMIVRLDGYTPLFSGTATPYRKPRKKVKFPGSEFFPLNARIVTCPESTALLL